MAHSGIATLKVAFIFVMMIVCSSEGARIVRDDQKLQEHPSPFKDAKTWFFGFPGYAGSIGGGFAGGIGVGQGSSGAGYGGGVGVGGGSSGGAAGVGSVGGLGGGPGFGSGFGFGGGGGYNGGGEGGGSGYGGGDGLGGAAAGAGIP